MGQSLYARNDCVLKAGRVLSVGAKILLVDDDPVIRELAFAKLSDAGYQPFLAENGAQALDVLRTEAIDLVISDIEMPNMDGFELTRNIRGDQKLSDIPVIVITASDHAEAVDRVFAEGATSFLAKPINWTLFNQAVMFVLRASKDQKKLRIARDQAEAGAKFKDTLMSVMSHELRTPLNAIIGFGQLLSEKFNKNNDPQHGEYAEYIVDGGKRLLNTVSDMLLASDARSGPLTINEADVSVGDIVEGARNQIRTTPGAAEAKINVKVQNPEMEICCDRALLSKAMSKLIENAIKFSPAGAEITVGAALTKSGDLALLVKDNGPGIPKSELEKMSVPFAQSDMSLKRSNEGLGLGLPMTKAIAAAHDAGFRIQSVLGEGTRALIIVPAKRLRATLKSAQSAA